MVFVLYLKAPGTEAGRADRRRKGEDATFAAGCGAEQFHSSVLQSLLCVRRGGRSRCIMVNKAGMELSLVKLRSDGKEDKQAMIQINRKTHPLIRVMKEVGFWNRAWFNLGGQLNHVGRRKRQQGP